MVPFDKQEVTVIRQKQIGTDLKYEPPLRIGFGINDETIDGANAVMGRTILVPGGKPNLAHYHIKNDVCWYILYGKVKCVSARHDGSERKEIIFEAGDFVYVPAGSIHPICNASDTDEASIIFCYIGVGNTDAAETVWLHEMHDKLVSA